ncbi:MAG: hypothetical protein WHS82_05990 [Candidatus Methanosuratincola sp.]
MNGTRRRIFFYRPSPAVVPVSITGSRCELDCPHCRGRFLSGMAKASMPTDLIRAFIAARRSGAIRLLITGGFTRSGKLPVSNMISAIEEGKKRTGVKVSLHGGLLDKGTMERVAKAGVDTLLLDVIGSQHAVTCYLGGDWGLKDYKDALANAKACFPLLAPHVLIGIEQGRVIGEYSAVDMIAEADPGACAILVLTDGETPDPAEVEKVMGYARDRLKLHLTLGCMRGRGRSRVMYERMAVDLGFDGIANPSQETLDYAEGAGLEFLFVDDCCVHRPSI